MKKTIKMLALFCCGLTASFSSKSQTSGAPDCSGGIMPGGTGTGLFIPFNPSVHTGPTTGMGARTTSAGYATNYSSGIITYHADLMSAGDAAAASWAQILGNYHVTVKYMLYSEAPSTATLDAASICSGVPTHMESGISCATCLSTVWYPEPLSIYLGATGFTADAQTVTVYINDAFISQFNTNIWATSCPGYYDLYSILMHEICHGLGFKSNTSGSTSSVYWYTPPDTSIVEPSIYDIYIWDNGTGDASGTGVTTYLTTLTSGTDPFTSFCTGTGNYTSAPEGSNYAYFNGTYASNVVLYLPGAFALTSSLSHVDPTSYSGDLMSPSVLTNTIIHCPSSNDIAILNDIGWNSASTATVGTSSCYPLNYMTLSPVPTIISPGTTCSTTIELGTYTFSSYTGYPLNDPTINWQLILYDNTGASVTSASGSGTPFLSIAPTLPSGHTFMRDLNGNVQGILTVNASDISGCPYTYSIAIGIPATADQPILTVDGGTGMFEGWSNCSSKTIRFYAEGASYYEVQEFYYVPPSGGAWSGFYLESDLTLPPGQNNYTFSGLDETVAHEFNVIAYNSSGSTAGSGIYTWPCQWYLEISPNPAGNSGFITISAIGGGQIPLGNGGVLNLGYFYFQNITITNIENPNITYTIPFDGTQSSVNISLNQYVFPTGIYAVSAYDINGNYGSGQISIQN